MVISSPLPKQQISTSQIEDYDLKSREIPQLNWERSHASFQPQTRRLCLKNTISGQYKLYKITAQVNMNCMHMKPTKNSKPNKISLARVPC